MMREVMGETTVNHSALQQMQYNAKTPTMMESLQSKKRALTAALADVEAAIFALEVNPEITKVLEILGRAGARL